MLVSEFFLSRLDYCNAALAGLPQTTLLPLQRIQNAAGRLITNSRQRDHITPVMKQLQWLSIKLHIMFKLCLMMPSILTKQCPHYMSEITMLTAVSFTRAGVCSANGLSFWKPKVQSKFGECALSYSGPGAWNSLSYDLQSITNTNSFKRLLKTHLLNAAY